MQSGMQIETFEISFPEDHLKLLGPEIGSLDPLAFYDRILSLFSPRSSAGKTFEVSVKGKKLKNPTKKASGTYEARFLTALGERAIHFRFEKSMEWNRFFSKSAAERLLCTEGNFEDFLQGKNFVLISCIASCTHLDHASPFLEIPATETKKEVSQNDSPS